MIYDAETVESTKFKAVFPGALTLDYNYTTGWMRADWDWQTSPLPAFDNAANNLS